jgi:sugar lactone lactonase YvrE
MGGRSQSGLSSPLGVVFDSHGNLWVGDTNNNRVLEFTCTATSSCVNGNDAALVLGQQNFTSSTYATTQSGLNHPDGVVFDSSGDLWVADVLNNRVLEFTCTATSSCTNGNAATLVLGQPNFTSSSSGAATQSNLVNPHGVVFDSHGNLWVADFNSRALEFTCTATSSCVNGNDAALVLGQPNFTTLGWSTSQTGLAGPTGVVFDSSGDLWVADSWNNRTLEFTCTATSSCTNGNAATLVLGQPNFTTDTSATSQTGQSFPDGVVFDSSGDLWVAEYWNNRTLEFTCTATSSCTNGNAATLVLGQPNFISSTGATTQSGLYGPAGVIFDSSGDLWVADSWNNRVLEYTSASSPPSTAPSVSTISELTTVSFTPTSIPSPSQTVVTVSQPLSVPIPVSALWLILPLAGAVIVVMLLLVAKSRRVEGVTSGRRACPNCGQQAGNERFCRNCGQRLEEFGVS